MKKYRVIGRNIINLVSRVSDKLGVPVEKIGYEIKKEEKDENGGNVIVLDVWVKEEIVSQENVLPKEDKNDELQKTESVEEKKKVNNEPIILEIEESGVYLTLNGKPNFNNVVDYIMDKEIKEPEFDAINEAYSNPGKRIKIAEYFEGVYQKSKIDISISDDKMKAYVLLTKPRGVVFTSVEEIVSEASKQGIIFGINEERLKDIINGKKYDERYVFAEGREAINGKNGKIDYKIKTIETKNKLKPTENDDGKVDFKNIDVVENVVKGTVLAVKILPGSGITGKNIFGEDIIARDGVEVFFEQGKNTEISEDGLELKAAIDGMVNINGKRIDVTNVYVVEEVGLTSGNIKFVGGVLVKGDVLPDYEIDADGNVEVKGNVEKAKIVSNGDVIIHGSCFGKSSGIIKSGNDVIVNFVESTHIEAEGNVIVNEGIMNSTVIAGKKVILVDKKGTVVGGEIRAAEGVEVINLGSSRSIKTDIEVGINPKVLEEIKNLEIEIEDVKKKMEQVEKNLNLLQNIKESMGDKMPADKEELLEKMIGAKFLMSKTIKEKENTLYERQLNVQDIKSATVCVHDVCYPGVKIKIRKGIYTSKEALRNVKFYYEGAEVKMTYLK